MFSICVLDVLICLLQMQVRVEIKQGLLNKMFYFYAFCSTNVFCIKNAI